MGRVAAGGVGRCLFRFILELHFDLQSIFVSPFDPLAALFVAIELELDFEVLARWAARQDERSDPNFCFVYQDGGTRWFTANQDLALSGALLLFGRYRIVCIQIRQLF